jgi:hypothetical protein
MAVMSPTNFSKKKGDRNLN